MESCSLSEASLWTRRRYKGDGTKEKGAKCLECSWVWTPHCQGHCVIWDRSIIPTVWPLTCLVAPGGPGLVVTDPPLCCVLQMGGGAVQTRAAGVHGGVPAAGLGTTNNSTRHTQCSSNPQLSFFPLHVRGWAKILPEWKAGQICVLDILRTGSTAQALAFI